MKTKRISLWLLGIFFLFPVVLPIDSLAEFPDNWRGTNAFPLDLSFRLSYGNGMFVAAGDFGLLYTSSDGTDWKERASGTNQSIRDVAFGGGVFVAVGGRGTILTSPDGVVWTSSSSGTGNDLHGVAYGGDIFVAVGNGGAVLTSSDGVRWTEKNSGTGQALKKVAFGGGTFVAVGNNGTIFTSPDGVGWTERNSGTRGNLEGIAYGKKTFVAVGDTILTSPDGIGWTERTAGKSYRLFGVAYGAGVFAAVADNGAIFTSSNGSDWATTDSGTHLNLLTIAYGEEKFLAAGEKGILLKSEFLSSPKISVSPTSLDFGLVDVGYSSFTDLTISNIGSRNLILGQITLSGPHSLDFNTRNDNCTGATLAPSRNCNVQIVFSPRSTGSKSATLSISSNDPDDPTETVSLSGNGTGDNIFISSGSAGGFCFVSTSTKGTGLEDYLDVLRKFRDLILLKNPLGETLVAFYYQHSPALAQAMEGHDSLRKAVAFALVPPLAAIAHVALYTSPAEKAFLFLLMAGVLTAGWSVIRGSARVKSFMIRSPAYMEFSGE